MHLEIMRCPSCGAEGKLKQKEMNGKTIWYCEYCAGQFSEESAKREYEQLEATIKSGLGSVVDEALLQQKTEKYFNLRSMLWSKVTANYIDSASIVKICREILAISPHDFLAEFFEIANTASEDEVAEYIQDIDAKKNGFLLDVVLDFIIKSLKEKYITPTASLLEQCTAVFSPEKKQDYLTRFESEAAKVQEGIYELSLPRHVFLAYSSKDKTEVVKLLNFIESNGLSCFAAFRNLQHGRDAVANYDKALYEAIDNSSIFLFISSVNSRSFSCDAYTKEIAYIRSSEMARHPECRSYEQIPEKYKKLRIEYRLDNKPTPIVDKSLKSFFNGLTYVEDYDQLITRLSECMDQISAPYEDDESIKKAEAEKLRKDREMFEAEKQEWQKKKTAEELARKAEEQNRAEAEAKRKAEAEAKQKTEAEARRKAEAEERQKAEARRKAEAERAALAQKEAALRMEEEKRREELKARQPDSKKKTENVQQPVVEKQDPIEDVDLDIGKITPKDGAKGLKWFLAISMLLTVALGAIGLNLATKSWNIWFSSLLEIFSPVVLMYIPVAIYRNKASNYVSFYRKQVTDFLSTGIFLIAFVAIIADCFFINNIRLVILKIVFSLIVNIIGYFIVFMSIVGDDKTLIQEGRSWSVVFFVSLALAVVLGAFAMEYTTRNLGGFMIFLVGALIPTATLLIPILVYRSKSKDYLKSSKTNIEVAFFFLAILAAIISIVTNCFFIHSTDKVILKVLISLGINLVGYIVLFAVSAVTMIDN